MEHEFNKIVALSNRLKVNAQMHGDKLWIETPFNTYTVEKFPNGKFHVVDLGYNRSEDVDSMFKAVVKLNNFIAYDIHNINLVKNENENLILNIELGGK